MTNDGEAGARSARLFACIVLAGLCIFVLAESLGRFGGTFEPLGPGAAPALVAGAMILCVLSLIAQDVRHGWRGVRVKIGPAAVVRLLTTYVLLIAYAWLLWAVDVSFIVLTAGFFITVGLLLAESPRSAALPLTGTAVVLATLVYLALTRVIVVALP